MIGATIHMTDPGFRNCRATPSETPERESHEVC